MKTGIDTVVVMGATGAQGSCVARELLARGHKVRAVTRKPTGDKALALAKQGAQVVQADFDDASSMEAAMTGAYAVFAVQNTWEAGVVKEEEQGKLTAAVAKKAGVSHFVYTSVGSANRNTGIPHFDNKYRVERAVRQAGFPSFTILRAVFFMQNFVGGWFGAAFKEGQLTLSIKPETRLQMIDVDDVGRFGALALEQPELMNGRAIDIGGDELTMGQAADVLTRLSGKKFVAAPTPIELIEKASEDFAKMCRWFDAHGYDAPIRSLPADYKIKPATFEEWAARTQPWR
ncbi:MAG: NmrA family NAD(P)-binding protein [Deltaproteobacteria bacterium]|nr:NmrA family NAD(P)-binding protein [Deltaproteobacteria bacterium]